MRRLLLWGPVVVYMIIIFGLSSESAPMPVLTENVWDKLLHVIEYGGLAVLFGRALVGEGLASVSACVLAVLLTSAYAASDEYHQLFVPLRSGDIHDWLADTVGAAAGAIGYSAARIYAVTGWRSTNQR
jgi:VanZ family protein